MLIQPATRLRDTKEYYFSKKLKQVAEMNKNGTSVINLAIGNPDKAPHKKVIDTLAHTSQHHNNHGYQNYKGLPELREAMAAWYDRFFGVQINPVNEVLPLMGSKEGIMHLSMAFLNEGDKVLVPDPGYPSYRSAAQLAGASVIAYDLTEETNWEPDLDQLEQTDLSAVKLMWINYPHMPTGAVASKNLFKKLIAFAKRHRILLCHDNPYGLIQPAHHGVMAQPQSILAIEGAKEVAVELNSLSKSHNMAGWRIGMLMASADIITQIMRFKSNMDSGMFLPVQSAAIQALDLKADWYNTLNQEYAKRKEKALQLLEQLGCRCQASRQGLFLWAKVPSTYKDGYDLSDQCLEQARVLLAPGGIFGKNGTNFIRLSLCAPVTTMTLAQQRLEKLITTQPHLIL